jgi:hypothetical protein
MTKNDVIAIIAKEKMVETIVSNIAKSADNLLQDLQQDIYIDLLSKDDDKIVNLYESGQLKFFITRMVINNIHSKNSPFWCKYKRFTKNANEITGDIADE